MKRRRAGAIALALVLALVAAACGGDGDGGDGSAAPSSAAGGSGTSAGQGSSGSANENVPGIGENSIKLGTSLPISGTAALAGQGLEAGIQIAVKEANDAGGVNGRKVELVVLDDAFDIPRLVANVRRLVEQERVYAIVSPAGSQALPGTWDFIEEKGTPVWGPVSPADPKLQPVFTLGPSRTEQLRVGIDYLAQNGVEKVALIGQDNELGAEGEAAAKAQVPKHAGMELVASEKVEPRSQEVSSAVLKARDAGAQGLLLATDNAQVALILQQVRQLGMNVRVVTDNGAGGTGGQNTVKPAGEEAAQGLIGGLQVQLPTSTTPEVEAWRKLAKAWAKPQSESNFSLQTYAYTKVFLDALQRMGDDLSYESFYRSAEATDVDTGLVPTIRCGPLPDGHSCGQGAALAEYRGGQWKVVREFGPPA